MICRHTHDILRYKNVPHHKMPSTASSCRSTTKKVASWTKRPFLLKGAGGDGGSDKSFPCIIRLSWQLARATFRKCPQTFPVGAGPWSTWCKTLTVLQPLFIPQCKSPASHDHSPKVCVPYRATRLYASCQHGIHRLFEQNQT